MTKKVLSGNTVDLNLYVYKNDGSLMAAPDELRSIKDGLGAAKGWIRSSERMDQEQLQRGFPTIRCRMFG